MKLMFQDVVKYLPGMLQGLLLDITLSILAMLLGALLGMFVYLGKRSKNKPLHLLCAAYIEIIRNTPMLVQLYLIYFGLSQFGMDISAFNAMLIAMVLNNAGYSSEILRGGFLAVSPGTVEAGTALGMRKWRILLSVELEPALKNAFPSLINHFVTLFLFESVGATIGLPGMTYASMNAVAVSARTVEIYLTTGVIYYVMAFIFISLLRALQKKLFKW